jgi:hypothetical protein
VTFVPVEAVLQQVGGHARLVRDQRVHVTPSVNEVEKTILI